MLKQKSVTTTGYLNREEAARFLGRSLSYLDKARKAGRVPYYRLSKRSIMFRASDLDAMMERFRIDPTQ